jgi:hypothetical protein
MSLAQIVRNVRAAYEEQDLQVPGPEEMSPDGVTVWLATCWRTFGDHVPEPVLEAAE